MQCPNHPQNCIGCQDHYQQLRHLVTDVLVTKHFKRDLPGFDVNLILNCEHDNFTGLHRFEESIEGNHIFRALKGHTHIVYAIDKGHRMVFLRAFNNFDEYKKFLDNKQAVLSLIR